MAAVTKNNAEDTKQAALSPRLKGRENAKDTLCRNVTIYGKCRYEDKGCAFSHTVEKLAVEGAQSESQAKKTLSVDSPSFTPSFLSPNGAATAAGPGKKAPVGISPKAASAAPFMPKAIISSSSGDLSPDTRGDLSRMLGSSNATPVRQDARTPDWVVGDVPEFVPRRAQESSMTNENEIPGPHSFDSFQHNHPPNPYLDHGLNGSGYFPNHGGFQQPVQYHQYAPIGQYNPTLTPYQRSVHDLFIPNDLREDIQKKSAAALQTLPNSQLPNHIESYHSLVPLDTNHKSSNVFGGYTTWVYKAQSSANGQFFALRRVEGFRLTNEHAIRAGQAWKNIISANVVRVVDVFTNRGFGDSSLFIATEYHPLSKTLLEFHHLGGQSYTARSRGSHGKDQVNEPALWNYVVQIASALKAIHNSGLAVRVLDPSKILVTGKNRIRLNGCAVLDVVQFDANSHAPLAQAQRQDLVNFALVILAIGSGTSDVGQNFARSIDSFKRFFKPELQNAIVWLYSAMQNPEKTIDSFITLISNQMITAFNAALHDDDEISTHLSREVENARLFRLMAKLNFITERPEFMGDPAWSETGERYYLKLFRDFVFHQVDSQNRPVIDLANVILTLNKLDAATEEKITLVSRDEQVVFVVTYRELKKGVESAFQDLVGKRGGLMR